MISVSITPSVGDGTTTAFTLGAVPVNLMAFAGGLLRTDYTLVGASLTFTTAPAVGEAMSAFADGASSATAPASTPYSTAAEIVQAAAAELGLGTVSDVFASSDPSIVQMRALLNGIGADLTRAHDWTIQQLEYTFDTVAAQETYSLPNGFDRFIRDTHWNRDNGWPLRPTTPAGWQSLKAFTAQGLLNLLVRVQGGLLRIQPTPGSVQTLAYEYATRFWASPTGNTLPTAEAVTANTDIVYFDKRLCVLALQLAFAQRKGFETTALVDAYTERLETSKSADTVVDTFIIGGRSEGPRWPRVPETGVGA